MLLQVKARHGHVSDDVRRYAEKRLGKLERRLHDLAEVELILWRETNPSISDDHVAEAIVHAKGPRLVAKESAVTYEAAVDRLVDKLERQIERHRDKRTHEVRRRASATEPPPPADVESLELGVGEENAA